MKLEEVIQLGAGNSGNREKLDAFMQDFHNSTSRNPIGSGRVYGDAVIDVTPFKGEIHLGDIHAITPGKGGGTAGLAFLTDLADKHGVTISGVVHAYGSGDLLDANQRLARWYRKNGFDVTDSGVLTYTPQ